MGAVAALAAGPTHSTAFALARELRQPARAAMSTAVSRWLFERPPDWHVLSCNATVLAVAAIYWVLFLALRRGKVLEPRQVQRTGRAPPPRANLLSR